MDLLIYDPFNGTFFLLLALFTALLVGAALAMKKKSLRFRRIVLACAMLVALVSFVLYKVALAMDAEYDVIRTEAGLDGFNVWTELPFHLCNVNMILIPVAALTMKKPLLGFCFFMGPLGAIMALVMPSVGFYGYSIFLPRMLGYYFTHLMVLFGGIAVAAFGLYRPRFEDILSTFFAALGVTAFAFGVSLLFRWTNLASSANYFYSVETEGNPVLDLFYRIIPVPGLYLLCAAVILIPYMLAVTALFDFFGKRRVIKAQKPRPTPAQ